jgi:hypothetical protein
MIQFVMVERIHMAIVNDVRLTILFVIGCILFDIESKTEVKVDFYMKKQNSEDFSDDKLTVIIML